jgi:aminoglycoside 2'-N-acetyltransferase I
MSSIADIIRGSFELGGLSTSRHDFYRHLGWEPWRGPSYVQHATGLVRTPEEDDGLMVLRVGPSAGVALDTAIVCESRSGDDW